MWDNQTNALEIDIDGERSMKNYIEDERSRLARFLRKDPNYDLLSPSKQSAKNGNEGFAAKREDQLYVKTPHGIMPVVLVRNGADQNTISEQVNNRFTNKNDTFGHTDSNPISDMYSRQNGTMTERAETSREVRRPSPPRSKSKSKNEHKTSPGHLKNPRLERSPLPPRKPSPVLQKPSPRVKKLVPIKRQPSPKPVSKSPAKDTANSKRQILTEDYLITKELR